MPPTIYFDEVLLDPLFFNLGSASGGPEFANSNLRAPETGIVKVAVKRQDPQIIWNVDFNDVKHPSAEGMDYFHKIWYGGFGSAYGLRVRIDIDYFAIDEVIATGDGVTTEFKLTKTYERPGTSGHPYVRRIIKPVVSTNLTSGSVTLYEPNGSDARVIEKVFKVYFDGINQASGWTIKNTTGDLHFTSAPGDGVAISVDMQWDTPMQFFTNNVSWKAEFPAEIRGLQMVECLPATLGIV